MFGDLEAGEIIRMGINVKTDELAESSYKKQIVTKLKVTSVDIEEHNSKTVDFLVGKIKIESNAGLENSGKRYKPEDEINYEISIKNTGGDSLKNFEAQIVVPKELEVIEASYQSKKISDTSEYKADLKFIGLENTFEIDDVSVEAEGVLEIQVVLKVADNYSEGDKKIQIKTSVEGYNLIEEVIGIDEYDEDIIETTRDILYSASLNTDVNIANSDYLEDPTDNYKISGTVWVDENENGKIDATEKRVENTIVKLNNVDNNKTVQETKTDVNGHYEFKKIEEGEYQVLFAYDENKYELTEFKKSQVSTDEDSDVVNLSDNLAITEIIEITDKNISGINMGIVEKPVFELSIDKTVNEIVLQNSGGTQIYAFGNSKLAKVEIPAKLLASSKVLIKYNITVKNIGNLKGRVESIIDYLPDEMFFSSDLNREWYESSDDELYTEEMARDYLEPGVERTVTLVLQKDMTELNTGLIHNIAEIYETINDEGMEEIDIENNISSADVIIGVKTGQEVVYITIIMISIVILGVGMYLIKKKVL